MLSTGRPIWFYHAFAISTCLIWSFSYVHIVWLAEHVTPLQLTLIRNYFSVPLLAVLWLIRRPHLRGLKARHWLLIFAIALASGPVYHLPLSWGGDENRTQASLIGLIIATVPIHVGWLAWVFLGERLSWRKILGLALGIGGAVIVLNSQYGRIEFESRNLLGPLAVTLASMIGAINVTLTRSARHVIGPVDLFCVAGAISFGVCLLLAPVADLGELRAMPAFGWWAAFYLGFMAISVAYIRWFTALSGGLPAAGVAMYLFIPAVLSALWAWLWQENKIGPAFFAGAAMVLVGLIFGERNGNASRIEDETADGRR